MGGKFLSGRNRSFCLYGINLTCLDPRTIFIFNRIFWADRISVHRLKLGTGLGGRQGGKVCK